MATVFIFTSKTFVFISKIIATFLILFIYHLSQKQKEAQAAKSGKQSQGQYADLLNSMYEQSAQSDSFNSLQKNMGKNERGARRV